MFNNFINRHDITRLLLGIQHGYLPLIFSRLTKGRFDRVQDAWKPRQRKPSTWWMIPAVRSRCNKLISGDETVDFRQYFCRKYIHDRRDLLGLTLGCGEGQKVLHWARTGLFRRIEGFELSSIQLEKAHRMAREAQLDSCIEYISGDVNRLKLPDNRYDVIFIEHALHHFSPLKTLVANINQWLAPNGYFVFDEYVGPSRFQWTDSQLRLANAVRFLIPEPYKSHVIDGRTDRQIIRPSRLSMILKDPSEAVESADILPLTDHLLETVEIRGYRGAILHPLLEGIAQNFLSEEPEAADCLRFLFQIEDFLTETGRVKDDFAFGIFRKKK